MKKNWVAGLGLLALLLAGCQADQLTKNWAMEQLREAPVTVLPGLIEFRYAENPAIAFSILRDVPEHIRTPLIFSMAGIALATMLSLAWSRRRLGTWTLAPFALILAGAFGNVIDRLNHGFVVDFVRLHWRDAWSWPIFNLADSLIFIGAVLLIWQFLHEREESPPDRLETAPAG